MSSMIVYGKQIFWYLVKHHPSKILEIFLAKEIDKKDFSAVRKLNTKITIVDEKKAQAMARGGAHQGFLAKCDDIAFADFEALKQKKFLIVTVGITDVGNIGAIFRTAYALGVDGALLCGVKSFNFEGAAKSSAGAVFDFPVALVHNELDALNELKLAGFEIIAADSSGGAYTQGSKKKALVLGAEGAGLSKRTLAKADKVVGIKMAKEFDSLNVSAAAAILIDKIRE